jgi:hypothetical protein
MEQFTGINPCKIQGIFTLLLEGGLKTLLEKEKYHIDGVTVYDDGNEEYVVLVINPPEDLCFYDDYEKYTKKIEDDLAKVIDHASLDDGDHAITVEKVTYGNDTIIALITCCK